MKLVIVNIKLSLRLPQTPLERIQDLCELYNVRCRRIKNFLQLYDQKSLRFSIFKCKVGSNPKEMNQAGNMTGIKAISEIKSSLQRLSKLTGVKNPSNIRFKVDNITFSTAVPTLAFCLPLNLRELCKYFTQKKLVWYYNPERYSALILKLRGATTLIYKTGSVIITGCKRLVDGEEISRVILEGIIYVSFPTVS